MDTNEGWIRPLTKFEAMLEALHQQENMLSSYCLTLNSKLPLQEYHIRRSLLHLLRKVPTLKICIRPKSENELWFHKMEIENIDFKVLKNADIEKEFAKLTSHHYNSFDGPLWCTRLCPLPLDAPCSMPEIKTTFLHQYVFLFGIHHAVTDGTSNIKICNIFLNLLNDVISGKPINDLEQVAEHVSPEITEKLIEVTALELMKDPEQVKLLKKSFMGTWDDILFLKAFPSPVGIETQTLNINRSLSPEETKIFLSRCKKEGVTIHAGYTALVDAAIVEMLVNAGLTENVFKIKGFHLVNMRRYWEGDSTRALGAHLGTISIISEVHNNINDFWNRAKMFHSSLNKLLEEKAPLKEMAVMMLVYAEFEGNSNKSNDDVFKMLKYYGTTNMGNVTALFPGEGDHVQATDFKRTTSSANNICSHVFQTFRGRFIYGLDYDASLMTNEVANLYVETIYKLLKKVPSL